MKRRTFLLGCAAAGLSIGFAQAQTQNPAKLRVALLPDENASTLIQNAQPLKKYLEDTLKKEIELVVTTDYSSMIEAMRFGRIEVAYFGPLSYVLAKSKAPGIEPFAVGVSKGSPTYKSVIIALADGPVKSIADIKGKIMGYGDFASTSSHLIPRAYLARNGLVGDKDYKFANLGAHDAVARAVQSGQVQAGGLSQEIFNALVAKGTIDGKKLVVLAESDPIPNYPMVMQGNLAPELKTQITSAFIGLKDPAILKTFRAEGFVATDDKAYDILRDTAKILALDLSKFKG
ncbi:phosphonate transport system substrate-binding protein [Pseudorhodoplanes sinuspersici]|uniref:Phosphate ABC transporter substrate-binding protein n=2 Tax=Pseudorhodoplanes sinuspersici TaxID=1235591 RepID=A0A1W6ZWK8_9HYPH|nr:phosphate/phosphite/phosphonate ABC transporter substrate-binding protein [Pseudorhodoplanes sinuspersici]ARQ01762.1 phosphate ABC transporter substrate-binding protein [Pseudorhodoplanes sinuspersici]RKE73508.1 phosphonate transport system substrate-binding protein [Pseudorhodoplanes sinuspersici]